MTYDLSFFKAAIVNVSCNTSCMSIAFYEVIFFKASGFFGWSEFYVLFLFVFQLCCKSPICFSFVGQEDSFFAVCMLLQFEGKSLPICHGKALKHKGKFLIILR